MYDPARKNEQEEEEEGGKKNCAGHTGHREDQKEGGRRNFKTTLNGVTLARKV